MSLPRFDSFSLADTLGNHLSMMYTYHLGPIRNERLKYDSFIPHFQAQILKNILYDLPSCATVQDNMSTSQLLKRLINLKPEYTHPYLERDSFEYPYDSFKDKATLAFSFGKDSLLTLFLAQELQIDVQPVYIIEHSMHYEYKNKIKLISHFEKEQGITTHIVDNTLSLLRDPHHLHCSVDQAELSWATQNTQYSFLLLTYARLHGSSEILFGNEFTTNTVYMNKDGFEASPCFDQSSLWTNEISAMTKGFTEGKIGVSSLIEPFTDIVVMATLTHRYPTSIQYIMSCFGGDQGKWCHNCSICTKMFLMLVASGIDPKLAGFERDLLTNHNAHFFSIFGGTSDYQYLNTDTAFNEQLFMFELAYKKGNRSDLTLKAHELYVKGGYDFDSLYGFFIPFKPPITIQKQDQINQIKEIHQEIEEHVFKV